MSNRTNFRAILPAALLCLLLPASGLAQTRWTTQIASFSSQQEAESTVSELQAKGIEAYWIRSAIPGKGIYYRVRVGRFASRAAAQALGEKLRQQGLATGFFVTQYLAPAGRDETALKQEPAKDEGESAARPRVAAPATPVKSGQNLQLRPADESRPAAETDAEPEPSKPAVTSAAAGGPAGSPRPGFRVFTDKSIGYSLEHPAYWDGAAWGETERMVQNVDGGASFKSKEDAAFLNVIWNRLPGANNPKKYDNSLLVDTIVKSMGSGTDTRKLSEISRRVETHGDQIRTWLEVKALFTDPGTSAQLNFLGRALITRCRDGILLVVVFHSQDAPPAAAANAEYIVNSVRAPQ